MEAGLLFLVHSMDGIQYKKRIYSRVCFSRHPHPVLLLHPTALLQPGKWICGGPREPMRAHHGHHWRQRGEAIERADGGRCPFRHRRRRAAAARTRRRRGSAEGGQPEGIHRVIIRRGLTGRRRHRGHRHRRRRGLHQPEEVRVCGRRREGPARRRREAGRRRRRGGLRLTHAGVCQDRRHGRERRSAAFGEPSLCHFVQRHPHTPRCRRCCCCCCCCRELLVALPSAEHCRDVRSHERREP